MAETSNSTQTVEEVVGGGAPAGEAGAEPAFVAAAAGITAVGASVNIGGVAVLVTSLPSLLLVGALFMHFGLLVAARGTRYLVEQPRTPPAIRHAYAMLIVALALGTIAADVATLGQL
jgi:hypothetical protein